MTQQPEALRLAALLDATHFSQYAHPAAAELRRLHAQRDALLEALKELTPKMPPVDAPCHFGIVPQQQCAHCKRIAKARAAIAAAEGEKHGQA